MRQAQGLSTSTLILIALGIIVLALSSLIFYDAFSKGGDTIGMCENLGGTCSAEPCGPGMSENSFGSSCPENQRCCVGN